VEVSFVDIVKILHSGEGEQWLEPRNKFSCVCDWFLLALYCFTFLYLWYYLSYFQYCIHFIILHFWSILISTRKQLSTSTHHLEESKKRSS